MLVTQSCPPCDPIDCGHESIKDSILTFNSEIFMRHRSESVNCAWHIFNSTFLLNSLDAKWLLLIRLHHLGRLEFKFSAKELSV